MSKRITSLLAGAFVLGGLSFGAAQLRAGEAADCEGAHGTCATQMQCENLCEMLFPGQGSAGICHNGCCYCAER